MAFLQFIIVEPILVFVTVEAGPVAKPKAARLVLQIIEAPLG